MKRPRLAKEEGLVKVVKFRVEPNMAQLDLLRGYCGSARAVYNILLWNVKVKYNQRKAEESYGFTGDNLTTIPWGWGSLTRWFKANRDIVMPWWREIPYRVLSNAIRALATALNRYFRKQAQFPVFKRKGRSVDAGLVPITFSEKDTDWFSEDGRSVLLPVSRQTRFQLGSEVSKSLSRVHAPKDHNARRAAKLVRDGRGQVQEVTYSHTGGYWWVSVRMRVLPKAVTRAERRPELRQTGEVLGIDAVFGIDFIALSQPVEDISDEHGKIRAPRYLLAALKKLAKAQQDLSGTEPWSKRHAKALKRVQRLHGQVAGRREQWHQQLAIELTERFKVIGVETLNLKGMARKSKGGGYRFGRSVGEQGHGQFKQILTIQAAKRGSVVVPVSRFYPSSKTCSNCGAVKTKLLLSERVYRCETCNLVLDRDVNAARNIAGKARQLAVLDGVSIPAKQAQVSPVQSAGRCVNTPPPVEQPQSDAFPKQTTLSV